MIDDTSVRRTMSLPDNTVCDRLQCTYWATGNNIRVHTAQAFVSVSLGKKCEFWEALTYQSIMN